MVYLCKHGVYNYIKPPCLHSYTTTLYITRRHYVSHNHPHDACTVIAYNVSFWYHNVTLHGTITSHHVIL